MIIFLAGHTLVIPICTVSIRVGSGKHIFRTLYFFRDFQLWYELELIGRTSAFALGELTSSCSD
jgi:hypothetical protein